MISTDNTHWNLANEVANLTYNIDGYVLRFTDHIRDFGVYHDIVDLSTTNISHTLSTVFLLDQC